MFLLSFIVKVEPTEQQVEVTGSEGVLATTSASPMDNTINILLNFEIKEV